MQLNIGFMQLPYFVVGCCEILMDFEGNYKAYDVTHKPNIVKLS